MTDPCVFVVKPGAITQAAKHTLRKAGIVVVETDDPASVRFLRAGIELESSDMLRCAMKAIRERAGAGTKEAFTDALADILLSHGGKP